MQVKIIMRHQYMCTRMPTLKTLRTLRVQKNAELLKLPKGCSFFENCLAISYITTHILSISPRNSTLSYLFKIKEIMSMKRSVLECS
jgi:hypothetical protein